MSFAKKYEILRNKHYVYTIANISFVAEEENNGECQPQNGDENCETCEKHE